MDKECADWLINLIVRRANVLYRLEIENAKDLLEYGLGNLLATPNMGIKSFVEIMEFVLSDLLEKIELPVAEKAFETYHKENLVDKQFSG